MLQLANKPYIHKEKTDNEESESEYKVAKWWISEDMKLWILKFIY